MSAVEVAGPAGRSGWRGTVAVCLLTAPYLFIALSARAEISATRLNPGSGQSDIYGAAQVAGSPWSVDLAALDYVEEEFWVSGSANIYARDASDAQVVKQPGVPYTTRLIVRRPIDAARFSGVLVIEPIHPSMGGTLTWTAGRSYITRRGHIYVAIGSGNDASTRTLSAKGPPVSAELVAKWFNPERYAAFTWPADDGARWDFMADVAVLLRSDVVHNPLRNYTVRTALATGWSFTGSLWRTFINEGFHERARRADGAPAIDGYLIGISSRWNGGGYIPLNSDSTALPIAHARRALKTIDVPVIEFLTANEVASGDGAQVPDRDARRGGHRLYELGGSNHSDSFDTEPGGRRARTHLMQLRARGYPFEASADPCVLPVSDVPISELANAALDNLARWATGGAAPPRAEPLATAADGSLRRDAFGNPVGGMRIAEFDVPRARYDSAPPSESATCPKPSNRFPYYRQEFDAAWLQARYGSAENYQLAYQRRTDELIKARWLLAEDGAALVSRARAAYEQVVSAEKPIAAATAAPATSASFGHYQPPRQYAEQVSESFYLTTRDGVQLGVLVARPAQNGKAAEGRFPVIWHHALTVFQEPADGTGPRAAGYRSIPGFTEHGYVVVQVARRGNGQSTGARRGYHDRNEAQDAYDVTEWLAAQSWSNGVVGVYGCSNTGDAAMHAISMRPPHLKAAFAGCFSWNKYDAMRRGGIFAQWGTGPQRTLEQDLAVPPVASDADRRVLKIAAEQHQQSTVLYDMWKSMPYRDGFSPLVGSRFWAEGSVSSYADQVRRAGVALYIQAAWNDEFRDQAVTTFLNVPGARMLIGPWKHCENPGFALAEEILRFFDQELKGLDTGLTREPPIHYYTAGASAGSEWRTSDRWPLTTAVPQRWYLGAALSRAAPGVQPAFEQNFAVNTALSCPEAGSGSAIQPCHMAGEGWSTRSAPLSAELEVSGEVSVRLQVSVDRRDAALFAYLEDVAPDGAINVVTEGRLKASLRKLSSPPYRLPVAEWHRAHAEDAAPLMPGERVELRFAMLPASYVFKAGHRLQITVTGADHRERDRPVDSHGARITLHSSAQSPSFVELPIVAAPVAVSGTP